MYYRTNSFDLEANAERTLQTLKNECFCTKESTNQDDIFSSLDLTLEFMLAGGPCFQSLTLVNDDDDESTNVVNPYATNSNNNNNNDNRPPRQSLRTNKASLMDDFFEMEETMIHEGLETLGEETTL